MDEAASDRIRAVDGAIRARITRKVLDGARLAPEARGAAAVAEFDAALRAAIAAAGFAPFHYARSEALPEPWRFTVLDRAALDAAPRRFPFLLVGKLPRILAGAGALVQVTFLAEEDPLRAKRDSDHHSAAAAAAMGLLLACEARGLGTYWCTAEPLDHADLRAWSGIAPAERWLGGIFVGLPLPPDREVAEGFSGKQRARRTAPAAGWMRWVTARPAE